MTVAQKWCPRDLIEGKKSETLHAHKIQQKCFSWQVGVALSGGRHACLPQKAYFVDFLRARGVFLTLWLQ